jgi:transmembrane sensor
MTGERRQDDAAARFEAASDWVVRLSADHVEDSELAAFDGWLEASPANAAAYDRALGAWVELTTNAQAVRSALESPTGATRRHMLRRWSLAAGAAAAAAIAAVVLTPQGLLHPAHPEVFETGRGEHRTLHLADGSTIDLNAVTRITVDLRRDRRSLTLAQGEAVFDVAHDVHRPFLVATGGDVVRVVGTRFAVRRRGDDLAVTVARGVVEVAADGSGAGQRLYPGQRLDRHADGRAVMSAVSADEAFGWRVGRLIYRDRPLREVVDDLNLQFRRPIQLQDQTLGETKISGVFILDDEDAVLRRLALLAPMTIVESPTGVVLRAAETSGR